MFEYGSRARKLPPPPHVVWASLVNPHMPGARPWLHLLPDEVEPRILDALEPAHVVWTSLWPDRPDDRILLELQERDGQTAVRFTLLTPHETPDASKAGHIRRRLNVLLFAELRFSYGQ